MTRPVETVRPDPRQWTRLRIPAFALALTCVISLSTPSPAATYQHTQITTADLAKLSLEELMTIEVIPAFEKPRILMENSNMILGVIHEDATQLGDDEQGQWDNELSPSEQDKSDLAECAPANVSKGWSGSRARRSEDDPR
jgi:hypothetical protein